MKFLRAVSAFTIAIICVFSLLGSGALISSYGLVENSGTPLVRRQTINCLGSITCADDGTNKVTTITGASIGGNYSQAFVTQTSVILTHNLGTLNVITTCYDTSTPPLQIIPNTTAITDSNDVTVTFSIAQSGYCVVNGLGGSGGGGGVSYKYQYYVSSVSNTFGTPTTFLSQFNSTATVTNGAPAGPTGGLMGYGIMEFPQAGAQGGFVTHIPPTWDGSSITFTMDTILDTGSGSASLTPYSACIAVGSNGFSIPYNAGSNVLINNPGGTTPTETYNLVVPITGCSAGQLMYIAFARPNTDTLSGNIYLLGGSLGIKY